MSQPRASALLRFLRRKHGEEYWTLDDVREFDRWHARCTCPDVNADAQIDDGDEFDDYRNRWVDAMWRRLVGEGGAHSRQDVHSLCANILDDRAHVGPSQRSRSPSHRSRSPRRSPRRSRSRSRTRSPPRSPSPPPMRFNMPSPRR